MSLTVSCACMSAGGLLWAAILCLAAITVPIAVVGGVVVARNRWVAVALRYCLSVAMLRQGGGLDFSSIKSKSLRWATQGVVYAGLAVVGLVVAVYLTICYVVSVREVTRRWPICYRTIAVWPRLQSLLASGDIVHTGCTAAFNSTRHLYLQSCMSCCCCEILLLYSHLPTKCFLSPLLLLTDWMLLFKKQQQAKLQRLFHFIILYSFLCRSLQSYQCQSWTSHSC